MERDDELICKLTARLCTLSVLVQAASVRTAGLNGKTCLLYKYMIEWEIVQCPNTILVV